MERLVDKTVTGSLVGVDGNAFAILGHFRKQAARQGWRGHEIELVIESAKSGDYDHLLATVDSYFTENDED